MGNKVEYLLVFTLAVVAFIISLKLWAVFIRFVLNYF